MRERFALDPKRRASKKHQVERFSKAESTLRATLPETLLIEWATVTVVCHGARCRGTAD
jgi:hypothetical protein